MTPKEFTAEKERQAIERQAIERPANTEALLAIPKPAKVETLHSGDVTTITIPYSMFRNMRITPESVEIDLSVDNGNCKG